MASSTAAAVPVHGEAGLYDVEAPLQQHQQHEQLPPPLDNLGEEASTSEEDRAAEQQSYPLGQSHTPLTSIPTLGQALIEGTNIDRKYVHSFLQVLADHSQFSDKYQHYEEDEYERKRKRKLRESERKMFFYAGQGSQSGEAKSSKRRASAAASSTAGSTSDLKNSASKKRRRRDQDRDRVLDKDTRRQMLGGSAPAVLAAFSAAGNLPAAAAAAMSHAADLVLDVDHSPASSSSSPAQTPPSGYGYVDQRAASMPNMLAAGSWDSFGHLHQQQQQSVHHQPQQQQFYAQQQQQHFVQHQAAGHAMLRQTRVPQQSYQPLQRFHGSSSSASLDYMPQMSPASSLSSSLPSSSSSYQLSSCYSSPSQSPQQPAADGVYVPAYQVHHHQQQQQLAGHYSQAQAHYPPQRPARMAVSLPAEMLSAAYHQHQVHPHHHHHNHHGYAQSEAMSGLMVGGGASLDVDGDEAWMSSSSSSLSADACPSAAGGELPAAGSESFSSFGPYVDPATGGLVVGDAATAAGHDGGMLACADMSAAAAAAAAAVEHFMHSNLHHQQPQQHEESSPEGQQLQAGAGMDEDWLNSFFSDDCSPTLLGGVAPGSGGNGDNAAACGLDSLFADMENFYGRLVN